MKKLLWKVLPIVFGLLFGFLMVNPPTCLRTLGWVGWLVLPATFAALTFLIMPGYLLSRSMFRDVKYIPAERDLSRKDIRLLAERFWKLGFKPAGAAMKELSPPGLVIGFVREDIATYGAIVRAEAGFGKTTFGFFSVLGESPVGLTTVQLKAAAVFPRAPGNMCQIFPRMDLEGLLLKHLEGIEFLHERGIMTKQLTAESFAEDQIRAEQKQKEYLRKEWFGNTVKSVCRLLSKINPYARPIDKQKKAGEFIRQNSLETVDTVESQTRRKIIEQLRQLSAIPVAMIHSGYGIASFSIALASGLLGFFLVLIMAAIGIVKGGALEAGSPLITITSIIFFLLPMGYLAGLIFGIAGATEKHKKKIFAVLGIVLNSLGLVILWGLIAIVMLSRSGG